MKNRLTPQERGKRPSATGEKEVWFYTFVPF